MIKGPNYREHRSINFRKASFEIDQALEACIEKVSTKNSLEPSTLPREREAVLTMVREKVKKLKHKIQPKEAKPILCDPDIKSYREALHKSFCCCTYRKSFK